MEYSYGRSDHRLEAEDFGPGYHDAVLEAGKAGSLLKQMIWILHLIQNLPEWLAVLISPGLDLVTRTYRVRRLQHHLVHTTMNLNLTLVNRATDYSNQSPASLNLSRSPPSDSFPRNLTKQPSGF